MLSGKPCLIYGDGSQTRDYVYVGDVARANLIALDSPSGSFNIGTQVETSVNDLVSELKNASGMDFKVEHADARAGEVQRISLDVGLAESALGWKPQVFLKEGVKNTWEWFNNASG